MKGITFLFLLSLATGSLGAQSILGTWQLTKQTSCLEQNIDENEEGVEGLIADMSSMSSRTPKVIEFKDDNTGKESIRIIDSRKSSGTSSFLYKYDGNNLYILDKRSRTIKGAYTVETLTADSLIFSNTTRPCETRVFVKIKGGKD